MEPTTRKIQSWMSRNLRMYQTEYARVGDAKRIIETCVSGPDLVDLTFAMRKLAQMYDDLRKEANRAAEVAQLKACAVATARDQTTIRGHIATGSVQVKMEVSLPNRTTQPEAYGLMCEYFGLPRDDVFRLHWPTVCERLTEAAASGAKLPPWLKPDASRVKFVLSLHERRKEIADGKE